MNPFSTLSEENHEQIRKYLRFFRQKKDGILRSLNREINDIKSERLNEDVYTRDDMIDFAEYLSSAIKAQVSGELSSVMNMGALALNQLLENAEEKNIQLLLDTGSLENQGLLEAVEKMSLDAMPKVAKKPGTLASFKDEAKAFRDESQRLEDAKARLQAEVSSLRDRLKRAERSFQDLAESKTQDEYLEKEKERELQRALDEAKEENTKRVSDTTQFQQMRKLMQSQAAKIRDLRRRLEKYEPDAVKEDDDL